MRLIVAVLAIVSLWLGCGQTTDESKLTAILTAKLHDQDLSPTLKKDLEVFQAMEAAGLTRVVEAVAPKLLDLDEAAYAKFVQADPTHTKHNHFKSMKDTEKSAIIKKAVPGIVKYIKGLDT